MLETESSALMMLILLGAGCAFGISPLILAKILGPRKSSGEKRATYECGLPSHGDAWVPFKIQYFLLGLAFLVFEVDLLFLLPWAISLEQMSWVGIVGGSIFLLLVVETLGYLWWKGVFRWE